MVRILCGVCGLYFRLYSISLLCSFCSVSSDVVGTQGCCLDSRLIQRVLFLGTICVPTWTMASICMSLILCWLLLKWYVAFRICLHSCSCMCLHRPSLHKHNSVGAHDATAYTQRLYMISMWMSTRKQITTARVQADVRIKNKR